MILLKQDKSNYINQKIVRNLKSGSGLYLPRGSCDYCGRGLRFAARACENGVRAYNTGGGIYLQKGEGFSDIVSALFRVVNANKDSMKNILEVGSNVVNLATATSKGVTDTIKNINDIREKQISGQTGKSISPELMKQILVEERGPAIKKKKKGSGFIYY